MSHAVVVVVAPEVMTVGTGIAAGTAIAAVGAAALVGYATYAALHQLHQEYQQSKAEFQARSQADAQMRETFAQQNRTAAHAALTAAEQTKAMATLDANAVFLREGVNHLLLRLPQLPTPTDPELPARCAALLQAMTEQPEAMPAHLEQYRRLAEQVAAAATAAANVTVLKGALAEECAALRRELAAPLLQEPALATLRFQLLAQLDALEQMAKKQPKLAAQGVTLLRARIHREVQTRAELQVTLAREAEEARELVGEVLAKLQAVSHQDALPAYAAQATAMLGQLGDTVATVSDNYLATLRRLAEDANHLFIGCHRALEEQTRAAYVHDQLTDVLLTMGYRVSQVAAEGERKSLVAAVDHEVGLEFHVDGQGRMGTQMVALTPEGATAGQAAEKKVCKLMDEILAALRARQCEVRERFRSYLADGEELRVVEMATQQDEFAQGQALQQMRME